MVNEMKERIPSVIQFVEDYEDSLAVVLEIRNSLEDTMYYFSRDGIDIADCTEGQWGKRLHRVNYVDCGFLTEDMLYVILDIFASFDNIRLVIVTPFVARIDFRPYERGRAVAYLELCMTPEREDLRYSTEYYYEKINEIWSVEIWFDRRG